MPYREKIHKLDLLGLWERERRGDLNTAHKDLHIYTKNW